MSRFADKIADGLLSAIRMPDSATPEQKEQAAEAFEQARDTMRELIERRASIRSHTLGSRPLLEVSLPEDAISNVLTDLYADLNEIRQDNWDG